MTRREVHVSWLRGILYIAGAGLWGSLLLYQAPEHLVNPPFDPFDHRALRDLMWYGEALTRSEKVGWLNYLSAFVYFGAGAGLRGRAKLRGLAIMLGVTAAIGLIGLTGILYLGTVDPEAFPPSDGGMRLILLFHVTGLGGLALAWWWLRRAAAADPAPATP